MARRTVGRVECDSVVAPARRRSDDATHHDEVTSTTLIAEVALDKIDAEVCAETSGVITLLVEEKTEIRQGAVIAQVT